jgi:pimeloyl-ACP methyl ester carboxylesterase
MHGGLPYLRFGAGPPLVILPGLGAKNEHSTGMARRLDLSTFGPFAEAFTVHLVNRRVGLPPGTTIKDLSDAYAAALAVEFTQAVPVLGLSTGGMIGLQLAADHPTVVRRLVVLASAYRLSESGRETQRRQARHSAAGQPRRAWAAVGRAVAATPATSALMGAMMWLLGPRIAAADPTDMIRTIEAEDVQDGSPGLPRITAPTLVIGGDRDRYYGAANFRATAELIPNAQLRLYSGKGHYGVVAHRPALAEAIRFLRA